MKIYYGTDHNYLSTILSKGITPRQDETGSWRNHPSHEEMVYLSVTYPFYIGLSAGVGDIRTGVVFEIELDRLDKSNLYPAEDYIFQALKEKGRKVELQDIKENLFAYQEYWQNSLEGLGNICHHGTIEPVAITRFCVIDFIL